MKNKRFWALSAAVLLLLTALLTACSTGDGTSEDTTKAEVGSAEETDGRLPSSLPDNLKFTGEEDQYLVLHPGRRPLLRELYRPEGRYGG